MIDKVEIIHALRGYRNSMTEFEPEEMLYLEQLVTEDLTEDEMDDLKNG